MAEDKLNIRVPKHLLERARRYAAEHNTTLARLVCEYLWRLTGQAGPMADAPTVEQLSGVLSPDASTEDYKAYLEEKHGSRT